MRKDFIQLKRGVQGGETQQIGHRFNAAEIIIAVNIYFYFVYTRLSSKHFTCNNSFNLENNPSGYTS